MTLVADADGYCTTEIVPIVAEAGIQSEFLRWSLKRPDFRRAVERLSYGMKMPRLGTDDALASVHPVPPVAEQARIVAKVNELMGLCDELRARQDQRRRVTVRFQDSALHALASAQSDEALRDAWERVGGNWPPITCDDGALQAIRQAILQLAVEGRLTRSEPGDGTAADVLQAHYDSALDGIELVNAEGKAIPEPYPLPASWSWVALGGVSTGLTAGWSAPSTAAQRSSEIEWGVLKVSACSWGRFRPEEHKELAPGTEPRKELEVRAGDFLISRANTVELVARSVVVGETPPRLMLSDKTLRIEFVGCCNPRYINLANLASAARAHHRREATGTSDSMRNVSQRAIRRTPIPLPPPAEQVRIVEAVERLIGMCNDLELALRNQSELASQLAAAAAVGVGGIRN